MMHDAAGTVWNILPHSPHRRWLRLLTNLEASTRRKLRMYLWRQWQNGHKRFKELRRGGTTISPWVLSTGCHSGIESRGSAWRANGTAANLTWSGRRDYARNAGSG